MLKLYAKKCLKVLSFIFSVLYIILYKTGFFSYKSLAIILSKIPFVFGIYCREFFYRYTLKKCGKNLRVHYGGFIVYPHVEIGNNCSIEDYAIISNCTIGNDVIISARVSIMSGGNHHDVDDLEHTFYASKSSAKQIHLGDNLWIGTHAVIMEDVASHNVIAAGAVVTKKFDSYNVIGGVPAKIIRKRGE